jgi:hypothetical protein
MFMAQQPVPKTYGFGTREISSVPKPEVFGTL